MKENKDLIEKFGKEWAKFWIGPTSEVYHRNYITSDYKLKENAFVMVVDNVIKRKVETHGNLKISPFRIDGVICHWMNPITGTRESGKFHTMELYPRNVVEKELLQDWLER